MPLIRTEPFLDAAELFETISEISHAGIEHARRADRVMRIRCLGCSHPVHGPGECAQVPRLTNERRCGCGEGAR